MKKLEYLKELVKREPSYAISLGCYITLHSPIQKAPRYIYFKDASGKTVCEVSE